jgi:hypothetical protein
MKRKLSATFLVGALALLALAASPASANDYYRYGGSVNRYFSPYRYHANPTYSYGYRSYGGRPCDDWHSTSSGAYYGRPSSGYFYNGYRRPYGYQTYNRRWWGW